MQKAKQRLTSLVVACVMMIACLFGAIATLVMPQTTALAETNYVPTSFGEGKLLITTTFNGANYYLSNTEKNSKGAPLAKSFTDVSTISEDHLWTIESTDGNWYIKSSADSYLYSTSDNNGLRVGTSKTTAQHIWKYDSTNNSFQNTSTSRFLGIYNGTDWRTYTAVNATNYKESSTAFTFYTVNTASPKVTISGNSYTAVGEDNIILTAELANLSGDITWTSINENVATIDQNGEVTAKAMGTTTITATVGETVGEFELTVYPKAGSELTIADAIDICELTGNAKSPYTYSTTGTITSIDGSEIMITDGTVSIMVYGVANGADLLVGDKIKVTGNLINYNNETPEFASGCTCEKIEDTDDLKQIKADLNAVNSYMNLSYKYTEDIDYVTTSAEATITFDDTSKRTSFSTEKQVWQENGITVTNNKESSTNDVADYANPARFYKNSDLVIAYPSMKQITFTYAGGSKYSIESSLTNLDDYSLTVNGTAITVTFNEAHDSYTFTLSGSQVRLASLTVYATGGGKEIPVSTYSDCEFRFKCAVDSSLADLKTTYGEKIQSYGIKVTAGTKEVKYNADSVFAWESATIKVNGEDKEVFYVVISLGDLFANPDRFNVEFTVEAFVEVDGIEYTSTLVKTYSVASMVQYLYEEAEITDVEHLYNYLTKKEEA